MIITHFNPWSIWGLWRLLTRYLKRAPWDGHFITVSRLNDWLALLGFDIVHVRPFFFRPPIAHPGLLQRLKWLEKVGVWCWPFWSGGYVTLARKRIITLTPIRPIFKTEREIVVDGVIEPVSTEC